jgi:tRNA (cytidine32/guanosine34-2'-O)-methyltransferase
VFVAKIFRGKDVSLLYSQVKLFFPLVSIVKPQSSRFASLEAFIVGQNYSPPIGYVPTMLDPILDRGIASGKAEAASETNRQLLPFLACGSLSGLEPRKP